MSIDLPQLTPVAKVRIETLAEDHVVPVHEENTTWQQHA